MRERVVQQQERAYRRAAVSLSIFVVVLLLFFAFSSSRVLTGMLSLELEPEYMRGEPLKGTLTLVLDAGELLPADSLLSAAIGNQSRVVPLSSVVRRELVNGEYYLAGMNLTGTGAGYGIAGVNTSFPEVTFELFIRKTTNISAGAASSGQAGSGGSTGGGGSIAPASPASTEPVPSPTPPIPQPAETNGSVSSRAGGSSEANKSSGESTSESSARSGNSSEQSSVPQSLPARTLHAEVPADILIGEPHAGEGRRVSGNIRAGQSSFSTTLEDGERISIIGGSVKANGKSIDEGAIAVSVANGSAVVSTAYNISEQGFGRSYHQEGSDALVLTLKLENLGLTAEESGKLRLKLLYRDTQLALIEREITMREKTAAENLTDNASIGIGNVSANISTNLTNATIVNVNKSGNVTIVTARSKIRVGQPVRWVKNITLERAQNVTIVLPKEAENVSVKKVEKAEKAEKEETQQGKQGNISALGFFPSWRFLFRAAEGIAGGEAGNAGVAEAKAKIAEKENATEVAIADNATQYVIEYVTDAPAAFEQNISRGKRVVISGPDELNYTDVLSFANIPERIRAGQESKIRIWWEENKSSVPFDAYDTNSNGYLDSVEWITPHLSNQTFTIIVIVKAEHLNENRTFLEDVYEQVRARDGNWTAALPAGHYLRVVFEKKLDAQRDITIYTRAAANASNASNIGNASLHVYEKDKNELLADFGTIQAEGKYRILLKNLQGTQDTFDLKIVGAPLEFDYVVDPAGTVVCNATASCFTVTNRSGARMAVFDRLGNLDLRGSLTAGAIGTLEGESFTIINSSSSVLAWINTSAGNMRILGTFTGSTNTTCSPFSSSVVRNFMIVNSSGTCFSYLNSTLGDLWISGNLTQNSTTI